MCNNRIKMVTPTKSNKFYSQAAAKKNGGYFGGGNKTPHKYRKTPSPTSDYNCFKTPPKQQPKADLTRCASEPMRQKTQRRSVTPVTSGSPLNFAGPKCLEPPKPISLPRPPTTWTRTQSSARQALSFEDDLDDKGTYNDSLSQQLKMLLKVQA